MAITVKVGEEEQESNNTQSSQEQKVEQKPAGKISAKLNIRKTLDGNFHIYDHHHIDIILMPEKMKILTIPYSQNNKISFSDLVYSTQDRFFENLARKGIIALETVKGGNIFGSMEASILKPKDSAIPLQEIVLLNIANWLEGERPALEFDKKYQEEFDDRLTEPDDEESTELGEVPQESEKGSIPKYQSRRYLGGWW